LQQSSLNNRIGRPGRVPRPVADFDAQLDPYARAILDDALGCASSWGPTPCAAASTISFGVLAPTS